jgi:nucleotide-binding universal stress UspA family protein
MRNVSLTVVNVLNPPMATTVRGVPMPPGYMQWQEDEGRRVLTDALKTVEDSTKQKGPVDVSGELMTGPPVPTLVSLSKGAEMVVVGSHGRGGFTGMLLGSVSTAMVHTAQAPVIVARQH